MTDKMTPDEWLDAADYEGGIYAGFEYGLRPRDVDAETYPEFHTLLEDAGARWREFEKTVERILNYNQESGK